MKGGERACWEHPCQAEWSLPPIPPTNVGAQQSPPRPLSTLYRGHLKQQPSALPLTFPAHSMCLSPASGSAAGQSTPAALNPLEQSLMEARSPGPLPCPQLTCAAPGTGPGCRSPRCQCVPGVWRSVPGTKAAPESPVWPSPWPQTSNLPRRALVQEAAGLRLESPGENSTWH